MPRPNGPSEVQHGYEWWPSKAVKVGESVEGELLVTPGEQGDNYMLATDQGRVRLAQRGDLSRKLYEIGTRCKTQKYRAWVRVELESDEGDGRNRRITFKVESWKI